MIPLGDTPKKRTPSLITPIFIAVNAGMFLMMLLTASPLSFFQRFGVNPAQIVHAFQSSRSFQPVYWTLLTSLFTHGGWWHLLSNMLFLWIFGDNVEDRMGKGLFFLFYLLCGVTASVVQILLNPGSNDVMVGASGAISGVMGAYLVLFPKASVTTLVLILFFPIILNIPAIVFMVIWFATQVVNMMIGTAGVGWGAHLGGFLVGFLLGWLFIPIHKPPSARIIDESYFR